VWTEENDQELQLGKWHSYTAKTTKVEDSHIRPLGELEIWPDWSEGVPTLLRPESYSPAFNLNGVFHRSRFYYPTIRFSWNAPYRLADVDRDRTLLPSDFQREWSGIYRLFLADKAVNRCGGIDPTGTLYIGCANATSKKNWSTLRTRIGALVSGNHHVASKGGLSRTLQGTAWSDLTVSWTFTGTTTDHQGRAVSEAVYAERWLLWCYRDSFGEYPPLNDK
jgi:hypothetical protein